MPIIPQSQVRDFVRDTLLNVRNGLQDAVDDGLVLQAPKTVDFQITVVADGEIMVMVAKGTQTPDGEVTTTRTVPGYTERAVRSRTATRVQTANNDEVADTAENATDKTDGTDNTVTANVDESQEVDNTQKSESGAETGSGTESDNVSQVQSFGRSSSTTVEYERSED